MPLRRFVTLFSFLSLVLSGTIVFAQPANTIETRFPIPAGFKRVELPAGHFGQWLRHLPLEEAGAAVHDFRGRVFKKGTDSTVAAVVRLPVPIRRLEQCMDVLMRLWMLFLQDRDRLADLEFPLADGTLLSWRQWQTGLRPEFRGLQNLLLSVAQPDSSAQALENYLRTVFAATASHTFYHYYPTLNRAELQPGDFIVRRQRKGHAVLILDVALNSAGEKRVLVAQGDTPACGLYILKNPKTGSAWFTINDRLDYLPLPISKKMYWGGLRRFPAKSYQ